ncbi:MAG: hypothetical protein M1825_000513 [Sarcosagium campestre]|nr:MAG: hypothetical protein M1825_000513 [Sarcosagium campestre]
MAAVNNVYNDFFDDPKPSELNGRMQRMKNRSSSDDMQLEPENLFGSRKMSRPRGGLLKRSSVTKSSKGKGRAVEETRLDIHDPRSLLSQVHEAFRRSLMGDPEVAHLLQKPPFKVTSTSKGLTSTTTTEESPVEENENDATTTQRLPWGVSTRELTNIRFPEVDGSLISMDDHPNEAREDDYFRDGIIELQDLMTWWVQKFFTPRGEADELWTKSVGASWTRLNDEFISYAGFIAGPGQNGWNELLEDGELRQILIYGALAKCLEIWVFGRTLFGLRRDQEFNLQKVEMQLGETEGFARQKWRAATTRALLADRIVPESFGAVVEDLTLRFYAMVRDLLPPSQRGFGVPEGGSESDSSETEANDGNLFSMKDGKPHFEDGKPHFDNEGYNDGRSSLCLQILCEIMQRAGKLSIDMRREDTIFYLSRPNKDDTFVDWGSDAMRALNLDTNLAGSPSRSAPDLLVRICCFPAVVTYKPGNGAPGGENSGWRWKTLVPGDVAVHWDIKRAYRTKERKAEEQLKPMVARLRREEEEAAKVEAQMSETPEMHPTPVESESTCTTM